MKPISENSCRRRKAFGACLLVGLIAVCGGLCFEGEPEILCSGGGARTKNNKDYCYIFGKVKFPKRGAFNINGAKYSILSREGDYYKEWKGNIFPKDQDTSAIAEASKRLGPWQFNPLTFVGAWLSASIGLWTAWLTYDYCKRT